MATLHKILVVEDDPDIQAIVRLALELTGGYTVEVCATGYEAIERAPMFAPDMILLDVMMPGIDGPDTLHALRALPQLGNTPIIFLTARVQPHDLERYRALGVRDVIAKPFNPMSLAQTLQTMWSTYDRATDA
ncbi:MAG: response regulator [Chloroflexaceae bacterium]|nr:response regulator [Chloroflexaceae bacterium]